MVLSGAEGMGRAEDPFPCPVCMECALEIFGKVAKQDQVVSLSPTGLPMPVNIPQTR